MVPCFFNYKPSLADLMSSKTSSTLTRVSRIRRLASSPQDESSILHHIRFGIVPRNNIARKVYEYEGTARCFRSSFVPQYQMCVLCPSRHCPLREPRGSTFSPRITERIPPGDESSILHHIRFGFVFRNEFARRVYEYEGTARCFRSSFVPQYRMCVLCPSRRYSRTERMGTIPVRYKEHSVNFSVLPVYNLITHSRSYQ